MDIQSRSLAQVSNESDTSLKSFNSYLTVFAINLAHRFPDVTDLNSIDYGNVKAIAQFSAICSSVALDTWDEQSQPNQRRQQMGSRTTRAVS